MRKMVDYLYINSHNLFMRFCLFLTILNLIYGIASPHTGDKIFGLVVFMFALFVYWLSTDASTKSMKKRKHKKLLAILNKWKYDNNAITMIDSLKPECVFQTKSITLPTLSDYQMKAEFRVKYTSKTRTVQFTDEVLYHFVRVIMMGYICYDTREYKLKDMDETVQQFVLHNPDVKYFWDLYYLGDDKK